MLFGRLPGEGTQSASTLFAALPSYATLVGQYLDRFGPYRLQPYAMPMAMFSFPAAPVPMAPVVSSDPTSLPEILRGLRDRGPGGAYRDMSPDVARRARIDDIVRRGVVSGPFSADPFGGNTNQLGGFGRAVFRGGLERGLSPERARHVAAFADQRNAARGRYAEPVNRGNSPGGKAGAGALSGGKTGHPGRPGGPR